MKSDQPSLQGRLSIFVKSHPNLPFLATMAMVNLIFSGYCSHAPLPEVARPPTSVIILTLCETPFSSLLFPFTAITYNQSKRYCPVAVAIEGSALWRNTLATALLHDRNRTVFFGLIVLKNGPRGAPPCFKKDVPSTSKCPIYTSDCVKVTATATGYQ